MSENLIDNYKQNYNGNVSYNNGIKKSLQDSTYRNTTINTVNPISSLEKTPKNDVVDITNKKSHKKRNILLGICATTLFIGGAILGIKQHKNQQFKAIINEYKQIKTQSGKLKESLKRTGLNINSIDSELSEILKADKKSLSRSDKLERLKDLSNRVHSLNDDHGFLANYEYLSSNSDLSARKNQFVEALPQEIQDAIKSGDFEKVRKLYANYKSNLIIKSKTAAPTIEEALSGIFGQNHSVKKYTYDLSQEAEGLSVSPAAGGWRHLRVSKNNEIGEPIDKLFSSEMSSCVAPGIDRTRDTVIKKGDFNGRKFVTLSYTKNMDDKRPKSRVGITLYSPAGKDFTPAQKDLLKIDPQKLTKEQLDLLQKLPIYKEDLNFDAILSLVQTLASSVK